MPVVVKVCFHSLVYFCSMGIKPGSLESLYFLSVQSNAGSSPFLHH